MSSDPKFLISIVASWSRVVDLRDDRDVESAIRSSYLILQTFDYRQYHSEIKLFQKSVCLIKQERHYCLNSEKFAKQLQTRRDLFPYAHLPKSHDPRFAQTTLRRINGNYQDNGILAYSDRDLCDLPTWSTAADKQGKLFLEKLNANVLLN